MGARIDAEIPAADAAGDQAVHLLEQDLGIDHHAVANQAERLRVKDPGGNEMQLIHLVPDDDGMPRVVSSLGTDDHLGAGSQKIDGFPLSFVSPLRADNNQRCHLH